jgi:hypothetical protein
MRRGTLAVLLGVIALVALLFWSTLSAQRVECRVCVAYGGGHNCAAASAADEHEATRAAQTTACGTLARGMDKSIACGRQQPVEASCRRR